MMIGKKAKRNYDLGGIEPEIFEPRYVVCRTTEPRRPLSAIVLLYSEGGGDSAV